MPKIFDSLNLPFDSGWFDSDSYKAIRNSYLGMARRHDLYGNAMSPSLVKSAQRSFMMGRYLVTNEQLAVLFNEASVRDVPASTYFYVNRFNPSAEVLVDENTSVFRVCPGRERHPVTGITWAGAKLVAHLVGGRLPFVAEWRVVAAGPDRSRYPWGDDPPSPTCANVAQFVGQTVPVGEYRDHRGFYDLIGNADEWCEDDVSAGSTEPRCVGGTMKLPRERVVVGGSWATPIHLTGIWVCRAKWARIGTRSIGCRIVWDDIFK